MTHLKIILPFALVYLLGVFPFAYFRHDDWFIIGNAVTYLPGDWEFLWRPTLFHLDTEFSWFFRPFFKGGVYLFYQLFGYEYYFWLSALLAMVLGTVLLTRKAIVSLAGPSAGYLFVVFFCAAVPVHFASLVWMGEGMMNLPQILLLAACFYFFSTADLSNAHRDPRYWWGLLAYLLSFGFKEKSVFFLPFLVGLVLCEDKWKSQSLAKRFRLLLPYFVLTSVYLVVRLGLMSINQQYANNFSASYISYSLFIFGGSFGLMALSLFLSGFGIKREALPYQRLLVYGGCVLLSCVVYVGHPFFSPGWLYYPGYFMVVGLALVSPKIYPHLTLARIRRGGAFLALIGGCAVASELHRLGWWQWHHGQREITQLVQGSQKNVNRLAILNCESQKFPRAHLRRVVGFEGSLYEMWRLQHGNTVKVSYYPCHSKLRKLDWSRTLIVRWQFPRFDLVLNSLDLDPTLKP